MMSRLNSMLFSAAHTPIQCLFAGDMSPFLRGKSTGCFYLFAPEHAVVAQQLTLFFLHELFLMSRLTVARFD
jgi:hypothetical protein